MLIEESTPIVGVDLPRHRLGDVPNVLFPADSIQQGSIANPTLSG
jgi:hypothetical protein